PPRRHAAPAGDDRRLRLAPARGPMMVWLRARHLPVLERGVLAGLVAERDITLYLARHGPSVADRAIVRDVMVQAPETAAPEDAMLEASAGMARLRIGCLPVLERGDLVGIVTTGDILAAYVRAALAPEPGGPTVGEAMTERPAVAHEDDRLADAAGRM